MAAAKRPLAVIAICLALIAVVMLAFAIRKRMSEGAPELPVLDAAPVPVDATVPDEGSVQFVDPWGDAAVPDVPDVPDVPVDPDAPNIRDGGVCRPCDSSCRRTCMCRDNRTLTSWSCSNGCCGTDSKTCDEVCASHGGAR